MHPFSLFAAAGLVLLAAWFAAEALGAWDRGVVRRALAGGACPRLRAAKVRCLAFSAAGLVSVIAAAVALAGGPRW